MIGWGALTHAYTHRWVNAMAVAHKAASDTGVRHRVKRDGGLWRVEPVQ